MRLVVAFDTATDVTAVGLAAMQGSWGEAYSLLTEEAVDARRAALSRLAPSLKGLLEAAGHRVEDVHAVVVGIGPGSFTGVRIGVATAKGLAFGLGAPLFGASTLDAVAWRFSGHEGLLGVVGDAMRGEVYPMLYRCAEGRVERLGEHRVAKPEEAAEEFADGAGELVTLAGNGLAKYSEVFAEALGKRARFADEGLWHPSGGSLLAAAHADPGLAGAGEPGQVLPIYARLSDAEEAEAGRPIPSVLEREGGEACEPRGPS
jgi:N6-L-threonylcarbamoyladenine synthase